MISISLSNFCNSENFLGVAEEVHHVDRVCEEDVASLNDIDCLVLDQPECANESETLAKQTEGVTEPMNGRLLNTLCAL